MEGFEQERRGLFDGLTVPHSLKAIIIAFIGLFVFYFGIRGIELAFADAIPGTNECRSIAGMLGNLSSRMGKFGAIVAGFGGWSNHPVHYNLGVWVLFWGWTAVVWSFFSGAINRIAAMKLAREESIELTEALKFGGQKLLPNLLSILFVFLIGGFLYLVMNAGIAGWIGRIPVVGEILVGVLFILLLLSSFLIVSVAALGVLGFNLSSSAIATEASDTFDGVSRAWNYILARPWTVFLSYMATFGYIAVVLFFGSFFLKISVKSLSVGGWGMGANPIHEVVEDDDLREKLDLPKGVRAVRLPGKQEYLYKKVISKELRENKKGQILYRQGLEYAIEKHYEDCGRYPPTLNGLLFQPKGEDYEKWDGPYLEGNLPKDKWGQDFAYHTKDPTKLHEYEIVSLGRNGKAGDKDDRTIDLVQEELGALGPKIDIKPAVPGSMRASSILVTIWVNIARVLLYAYVIAYFFCAQTMLYFLLRKDIEGDDYHEITLEDTYDDDEGPFDYEAPKPKATPLPTATKAEEKKDEPKAEEKKDEPKAEEKPDEAEKAEKADGEDADESKDEGEDTDESKDKGEDGESSD